MCLPIFSLTFLTGEHGQFICGDNCVFRYLPIGRNIGPFSINIFCLWLIWNGSLPISFLYSAFPYNMLIYSIVSEYDVLINSSWCQYTCSNIHVRLIWDGCCFISDYRSECFPLKVIFIVNKLSDTIFNAFYMLHTQLKYHPFLYYVSI